jgi:hypothetical protein
LCFLFLIFGCNVSYLFILSDGGGGSGGGSGSGGSGGSDGNGSSGVWWLRRWWALPMAMDAEVAVTF